MYAIVDIAGQQFKVEKDQKLYVHRLEGAEGKQVSFERVMLLDTGTQVLVGDPVVKGASVSATILAHVKSDKVLVFKKKRRKGYQKLNGHRQQMTQIQIAEISEKSAAKPKKEAEGKPEAASQKQDAGTVKETAAKKPAAKKAATGEGPKKSPEAGSKSTAAKSAAAKKPAAKKPAAKKETGEKKDAE